MDKLIIIDGNSLINRAFYALPPLNNKDGIPTQAVYGFTTMLVKVITDYAPKYLAVAFDMRAPTFRHKMYDGYKATRKGMPEELAVQMPILKNLLTTMGIKYVEQSGFEADDIIGTMAKTLNAKTLIVTGDKDALQLIDDNTTVLLTKRGISEVADYNRESLVRDFGLTPSQIIDYKALCGDSSDNIPGVAGVGDKTATKLIQDYSNLDGVYNNIHNIAGKLKDKLVNDKEKAYLSYKLATIDTAMPLDVKLDECTYGFPFEREVKQFFIDNGFKSLFKRDELYASGVNVAMPSKEPRKKRDTILVETVDALKKLSGDITDQMSIYIGEAVHVSMDDKTEYIINIQYSLLSCGLDYNSVMEELKPALENPRIKKIVHNAKLVKKCLAVNKINLVSYFDTMLAQYLIDMNVNFERVVDILQVYNMDELEIATGLYDIYLKQTAELDSLNMKSLYNDIELPLIDVLYQMENHGFRVDTSVLTELGDEFVKRQQDLTGDICAIAGQDFNIGSPKQLAQVLFTDMGIEFPLKGKKISTSKDILELIIDKSPIVQKILDYRFVSKLNSTYVEGLKKLVSRAGVVHTEFKQMLTQTGRLSSVEPNLQNIPIRSQEGRELRRAFVASENCVLIGADYSQIELRLMAHFSGDETMINAFKNSEDVHTSTASEVFGVPRDKVTADMRRDAKAVNFGIIYGISDYGLAQNLGITSKQAKEYIAKYFEKFAKVKQYIDNSVALAKKKGYAETMYGRIRRIPELVSANYSLRGFGERVAMNMPLQGTASDIIKIAMLNVSRALVGLKSKLILQVHDELIIDAHESEIEKVKEILKNCMGKATVLAVPLDIEIGQGKSWYDCK